MTELLFQTDSYVQTFTATVIGQDEENHGVVLNRTAFYPGGGGQTPDRGWLTINGSRLEIRRAQSLQGQVIHLLSKEVPLPAIGTGVHGQIDWELRYQLMRTHTAMHILCGVVFRDYGALVTGGNIEPLQGRMDFEFETLHKEIIQDIEAAINQEVANARPIRVALLPREEAFQIPDLIRTKINLLPEHITEIRVVEIEGLDLQADGGTHVRNTSEVGHIRIPDYKSKGRINKRIYVELD
ncbi:MAG: alanyl-tRNA editing protein [Chloroflexota bacterium]